LFVFGDRLQHVGVHSLQGSSCRRAMRYSTCIQGDGLGVYRFWSTKQVSLALLTQSTKVSAPAFFFSNLPLPRRQQIPQVPMYPREYIRPSNPNQLGTAPRTSCGPRFKWWNVFHVPLVYTHFSALAPHPPTGLNQTLAAG